MMRLYICFAVFKHDTFMDLSQRALALWAISLLVGLSPSPASTAQEHTAPSMHPAASLPTLGEGGDLGISDERRMGDRIAREMFRDPDYMDDPILLDYVNSVWQPLLAAARLRGDLPPELNDAFAWRILLGRDRSVNAFALPGGYFGLHLGLLGVVANRDELASVLAHELSHVTQRHIARVLDRQKSQTPLMLGAMVLGMLAASKSANVGNALVVGGQAAVVQSQLNFSRDMEREADRTGWGVMTQAGFAPQGFVSMFDKLQQSTRLNDNGAYPYLRSHPLTTERIADMQSRLPLGQAISAPGRDLVHAMMAARARALAQTGPEQLATMVLQARQAEVQTKPLPELVALLYGAAIAAGQLGDRPQASALLVTLAGYTAQDPAANRQTRFAQLELALSTNNASAAATLAQALEQGSSAGSDAKAWQRTHTLLQARTQMLLRHADQAAQTLQLWLARVGNDASGWQLLATAQATQGQTLRAIRAEAEAQVAQLDYSAAADRFRAAQEWIRKAPDASTIDQIEVAVIDARSRDVRQLLQQQASER